MTTISQLSAVTSIDDTDLVPLYSNLNATTRRATALQFKQYIAGTTNQGSVILVAGVAVVPNTLITANSLIFLTSQKDGGTPGFLRVTARTPGVSFTITSSNAADTSTVAYRAFEP